MLTTIKIDLQKQPTSLQSPSFITHVWLLWRGSIVHLKFRVPKH